MSLVDRILDSIPDWAAAPMVYGTLLGVVLLITWAFGLNPIYVVGGYIGGVLVGAATR